MANALDPPASAHLAEQLRALAADRDYWRAQHDLVMQDWKDDLDRLKPKPDTQPARDTCREALGRVLRFYDHQSGAVASRIGQDFLADAFSRALKAFGD